MGSPANTNHEAYSEAIAKFRAENAQKGKEARATAGATPSGRGAVIEHRTDERPRRAPYVPRSQRE